MQIVRNRPSRLLYLPIDGNLTNINQGAVIMPGVTDENNRSVAIVASGAAADSIGLLAELHNALATTDADPDAGTIKQTEQAGGRGTGGSVRGVEPFLPGCEVGAEMANDTSNDVAVASATSTVLTITSIEDDIDGSWIYVRSGTASGLVLYQTASASGTATIKSASTTTLDNTSRVLIMRRKFHQTVALNTAADKIKSTAAAGSLPWRVLKNEFRRAGDEGWIELDPAVHHNLNVGTGGDVKFRQVLIPVDTSYNPLD
ncbi:MAG: hypothetical protein QME60_01320 [Verrucomicrobiota bacterium]|nr:hypothetical protein [Verrucomicrobiota bacterium]